MAQALFYRGFGRLLFFSFPVLLFFSSCRAARNFTSPLPGEYSVRI
ncbi:metallophosphoesterase, partial [Bacteroides stercoris]